MISGCKRETVAWAAERRELHARRLARRPGRELVLDQPVPKQPAADLGTCRPEGLRQPEHLEAAIELDVNGADVPGKTALGVLPPDANPIGVDATLPRRGDH